LIEIQLFAPLIRIVDFIKKYFLNQAINFIFPALSVEQAQQRVRSHPKCLPHHPATTPSSVVLWLHSQERRAGMKAPQCIQAIPRLEFTGVPKYSPVAALASAHDGTSLCT